MMHRAWLAVAVVLATASAAVSACNEDGTVVFPPSDAGAHVDATASSDAADESAVEASCGVDAATLDAAQVALGRMLVVDRKCTTCHGDSLTGTPNGVPSPATQGGLAYPPNLTPDPATGLGCWSQDQIVNAILHGIDNEGMMLCPPMPLFGSLDPDAGLDMAQAQAVATFLQSLTPVSMNVPPTPDCTGDGGQPVEAGGDGAADGSATDVDAGDAGRSDGDASEAGD